MDRWHSLADIGPRPFICGFCGTKSGSRAGYFRKDTNWRIYICSNCAKPTFFESTMQFPGVVFGAEVKNIPQEIEKLYNEARACTGFGAYTASVLECRKLLMHIAVEKGAKKGVSFIEYVDYLAKKGYVPPDGKGWVDHIRQKGNEANHEIKIMDENDAQDLINFIEMLLRFIYEFPGKVPSAKIQK